jgi:hypothetical protein
MKSIIIISGMLMFSIASCKKDRICECTDQSGNVTNHDIRNKNLNEARTTCESYEYDREVLGVHTYNECDLEL